MHFYCHLALFSLTCRLSALTWTKSMTNAFLSHKTHLLCRCLILLQSVMQDKDRKQLLQCGKAIVPVTAGFKYGLKPGRDYT